MGRVGGMCVCVGGGGGGGGGGDRGIVQNCVAITEPR